MSTEGENNGRPADGAATDDTANKAATDGAAKGGEQSEAVTLADDDEEIVVGDDGDDEDGKGDDEDGDEDGADKPRKKSRSQRRREENRRLRAENEELRRSLERDTRDTDPDGEDDDKDADLKEPKESDFPNDYLAFDRAMRRYETQKAIREENRNLAKRNAEKTATRNEERAHQARLATYNRNLEDVVDRIPDFDAVMRKARGTEIRNDVRDLMLESPKGPLLAYYLASHPEKVTEINRMSPTQAAREIGRLETRIRGPKPKTVTTAKDPARPAPKGGALSKTLDPATMSHEEYRKARESGLI